MEPSVKKPKIVVIVGQTGSGKTSLSLTLAEKFNGEVINADSRQVYKGLDIGTEKITGSDMRGIPHHLLSIISPQEVYDAKKFATDADLAITDITNRKKLPIIAGGTFFYIDLLLKKVSAAPVPPNPELRNELEAHDESELFAMLQEKDPVRAQNIDRHNKRRLMRALEILHVLPSVPDTIKEECPYDVLILGLRIDKAVLREQLRNRAHNAVKRGLIEETKKLLAEGVSRDRLSEIGLEYRLVLQNLDGTTTEKELLQKLEEKNWQYAKRQMVWLKRDPDIEWFEPSHTEEIIRRVETFLSN
jgi:tRNA dimethylallyltransferase